MDSPEGIYCVSAKEGGIEGCRETSAEVRLLSGGTAALESEGIALPAGPGALQKTGDGQVFFL
jgi:hypothetical protein